MLYFPKFLLRKIPAVTPSLIFNKFFTHKIQYLFFMIFESLLLFKSLIVTAAKLYKFHVLINRSFIDIFGQGEFLCKQVLSNSFYLTSLPVFQPYQGKQMVFKQVLDMTTQNMLQQLIQHIYFFKLFCLLVVYCYYSKANCYGN